MKTVFVKQIEKKDIIERFDEIKIDAMASRSKAERALEETKEFAEYSKAVKDKESIKPGAKRNSADMARFNRESIAAANAVKTSFAKMRKKFQEIASKPENIVHFFPRLGENILDAEKWIALKEKHSTLSKNQCLDVDGNVYENWIGTEYYVFVDGVPSKRVIERLGETIPEGGKLQLTSQEENILRRSLLSQEEKKREDEAVLKQLSQNLAVEVLAAEIRGESKEKAMASAREKFKEAANEMG